MGKLFKRADKGATETYYFGDEADGDERDYIVVRSSLTKGEANDILGHAPTGERDIKGGLAFLEHFWEKVAVDWSMAEEELDDDGNLKPIKPTVKEFREMDSAGANLIQEQLAKHLNKLLGKEVEKAEGESLS